MSKITANDILDVARSFIGFKESDGSHKQILSIYNNHKPLANGYKVKTTDQWCDTFVSAVAIKAGATDLIGTECGVERHVAIFKKKGIWIEDGTVTPEPGDIIVFNWDDNTQPNDGFSDHIGFVEQVTGKTLICIEGNLKDSVSRRTIYTGWGYIRGFARPVYAKSATATTAPKKTVLAVAQEVLRGAWGYGNSRKSALTKAGYDYAAVQAKVNELVNAPVKKSNVVIAKEVLAGKWGSGNYRRTALIKAGYDYSAVQAEVNKLLK